MKNLCRVLLVDDEAIILEGYQKLFDWEKHQCEVAGTAMDGEEAIKKAGELMVDIVIMDINLPKKNGLEAIREIREKAADGRRIYVVIVTGYDDFAYCREALRLAVDDFILKPVDFQSFGTVMDKLAQKVLADPMRRSFRSGKLQRITAWMEENLGNEKMSLTLLSEEMNMNSAYISQLFKKELGIGYHAYLNKLRVERAKEYLLESDVSITRVAEQVGFGDYRVFTKVFKSMEGETPSQFRKEKKL